MKNPFSGLFRARDKPQDSIRAAPVFYFGTSGSGKSVIVQSAIQLPTVYACVSVISETVASLPLGSMRQPRKETRKRQRISPWLRHERHSLLKPRRHFFYSLIQFFRQDERFREGVDDYADDFVLILFMISCQLHGIHETLLNL